jgi:hypothetical protein
VPAGTTVGRWRDAHGRAIHRHPTAPGARPP